MAVRRLASGERTPAVFETALAKFTQDAPTVFGAVVRLEPVAWELRPFSHLLRLAIWFDGDTEPRSHCFLKIFKPKDVPDGQAQMRSRVEHDYQVNRHIHDALAAFPGCGAVAPLACYPDDLAIVSEEAVGQTLLAHLEAQATWFPSARTLDRLCGTLTATGAWLRAFQTIDPGQDRIPLASVRAYIDSRLQRLVAAGSRVVTATVRDAVLGHIDHLSTLIADDDLRSVVIHADLAPGNVLVCADDRIVVLDFAMTSRGTRLHDLTRLYLQTDLLRAKPQFRPAVLDRLLAALVAGFEPSLSPSAPLFRLLSLLHRINHLGTLTLSRERFPARVYNRRLRAMHASWLRTELRDQGRRSSIA